MGKHGNAQRSEVSRRLQCAYARLRLHVRKQNSDPLSPTPRHLAAWMTVRSWTLENAPTLMVFRSPRRTAPYQMEAWRVGECGKGGVRGIMGEWPLVTNIPHLQHSPTKHPTWSYRSTSPMTTALGATQASGAREGTRLPRGMS